MQELIDRALDGAQRAGASYADVRVVERRSEELKLKNGELEAASSSLSEGFGVRLLVDGAWGFSRVAAGTRRRRRAWPERRPRSRAPAASRNASRSSSTRRRRWSPATERRWRKTPSASRSTRSSPSSSRLTPRSRESPASRFATRAWASSASGRRLRRPRARASSRRSWSPGRGSRRPRSTHSEVQARSYPNSSGGQLVTGGFEAVRAMRLADHGTGDRRAGGRPAQGAAMPVGRDDAGPRRDTGRAPAARVVRPSHRARPGASGPRPRSRAPAFSPPTSSASFRYGSELVNIDADATAPGGLGTFGYDDEGVPAQRSALVEGGVLVATSPAGRRLRPSGGRVWAARERGRGTASRSSE